MHSLSRRKFIHGMSLAFLSCFSPSAFTGIPKETSRHWLSYTYQGSDVPGNSASLKEASKRITDWSKDALRVDFHLGNTLDIKVSDMVRACGNNEIQLADETFFLNTLVGGSIVQLPMLIGTSEEYHRVMDIVEPGIVQAYQAEGCEVLGRYDFSSVHIFGSGAKPITSLADLRGRRIRTGRDVHNEFLSLYGANPSMILTPDVLGKFENGSLDGAVTSFAAGGNVWRDYLTSVLIMDVYNSQGYFIASSAAMASLPTEQRQYIRELFREEAKNSTKIMQADEERVIEWFRRKGITFSYLSESEKRDAQTKAAKVWETWANGTGPEAVELLAKVRAELRR